MEEYRNKVINLLANQSQNISKFTGKTSWNEPQVRGGHRGLPLQRASPRLYSPHNRGAMGRGIHLGEARTLVDDPNRGAMGTIPLRGSPDGPPLNLRGSF